MSTRFRSSPLVALFALACAMTSCTVMMDPLPPRSGSAPPPRYPQQPPPGYGQAPPPAGYAAPPPQVQGANPPPVVAAPPPSGGPCADPGPQDIPDLFDRPAQLVAGSTIVGCIARGDADLFLISVPPGNAGQLVVFSMRGQGKMAPRVNVFDANRKDLEHINVGPNQELRGWAYVAGGTSFYLRAFQTYGETDVYTLATTVTPLAEAGEPNDAADRATPLVPGRLVSAFLAPQMNAPEARQDWYRFDVRQDGSLAIDLDMSQGVAPIIKLFDQNRHEVTRKSAGPGERLRFETRVRRGVYDLRLDSIYTLPATGPNDPPTWLTRPYTITLM